MKVAVIGSGVKVAPGKDIPEGAMINAGSLCE